MNGTLRRARRKVGAIRRRLFESPAQAAWRRACQRAETTPRFTPGMIRMMEYEIRYPDLLSFCPQWESIFVKRALQFRSESRTPRILDCGANVGLASLFFRHLYPEGRITAFEADPAIFSMLDANMRGNGAAAIETRHAAIWTSAGTVTFRCEGSDSGMIDALPGAVEGEAMTVPSVRLRDLLEEAPVDLLKLDIEGAEDAVLADCEPMLHRVHALVMDLHEFDPATRQGPLVLERLTRAGFTYAVDDFVALPWREPRSGADSPFPARALQWAMTVRAWRAVR